MKKKRRERSPSAEPEPVRRDGGLCAAFVNTVDPRRRGVESYAELLAWAECHGVVDAAAAEELGRAAAERPVDASIALHRALGLRALLERIFGALVEEREPDPADVEEVNAALSGGRRHLVRTAGGYRWAWTHRPDNDLEALLWPIVLSVADLLASKYVRQVRRCAGQGCGLVFVDRTNGRPRKWCSDKSCGERTRARRRYHATIKPLLEEGRRRHRECLASRGSSSIPEEPSP
jgi:predicted RNA-binding Zn ribbon-like protein